MFPPVTGGHYASANRLERRSSPFASRRSLLCLIKQVTEILSWWWWSVVAAAGREICRGWCRYCEVSAALNHQVDELLVNVVTAVRSRRGTESVTGRTRQLSSAATASLPAANSLQDLANTGCVRSAAIMLKGLFTKPKSSRASKSCENLTD